MKDFKSQQSTGCSQNIRFISEWNGSHPFCGGRGEVFSKGAIRFLPGVPAALKPPHKH